MWILAEQDAMMMRTTSARHDECVCHTRTTLSIRFCLRCQSRRRPTEALMSSIQHRVSGRALSFSLEDEMRKVRQELTSASARIARTLVKDGPLTVTLVAVRSGGGLR